jgi:HK97 family phage major capsid protein
LTAGVPRGRLLGFPLTTNADMASPAAGAKTILFGDMSKFVVRRARPWLLRLPVNKNFQVPFLMGWRHDSNCVNSAAIKYITQGMS